MAASQIAAVHPRLRRRTAPCPKRPVSFLQSGHSAKPRFNEVAFYEAAVGDLDLPARKGHSENRSIAAVQFTARSKPAIKSELPISPI